MHDHECRGRLALIAVLRIFRLAEGWPPQPPTFRRSRKSWRRAPGQNAGLLELQNYACYQRCHGGAAGLNNQCCRLAVKRVTHGVQIA